LQRLPLKKKIKTIVNGAFVPWYRRPCPLGSSPESPQFPPKYQHRGVRNHWGSQSTFAHEPEKLGRERSRTQLIRLNSNSSTTRLCQRSWGREVWRTEKRGQNLRSLKFGWVSQRFRDRLLLTVVHFLRKQACGRVL
jgi:hypothetical protein